jgi:hypothetical protein
MKKFYLLSIFATLVLMGIRVNGQVNILKGSGMEKADSVAWDTSSLANDPTASTVTLFGYTDDVPTYGSGGALYIEVTNIAAGGTHIMFYQQVTIKANHRYVMNLGFKLIQPGINWWLEGWAGKKPVTGQDYGSGFGQFLAGFKWGGWLTACGTSDSSSTALNCTFLTNPQLNCQNTKDTISIPDSLVQQGKLDSTLWVGFKMGIWSAANTVKAVVDSVTLTDLDSTTNPTRINTPNVMRANLFPNPAGEIINIENASQFVQASVLNVLGQEVMHVTNFNNSIGVAGMRPGTYIIKLTDKNNNVAVSKFQKR